MKHLEFSVASLNDLLRSELGVTGGGFPKYQWRFCGELTDIYAVFRDDGTKAMDEVYDPNKKLYYAKTRTVRVLQSEKHAKCWAICYWKAPATQKQWLETYGTLEDYPGNGLYMICSGAIHSEGNPPSEKTTRQFIEEIRRLRRKTVRQRVEEDIEHDKAEDKQAEESIGDFFLDKIPAFVNVNPGKRGGHVSFGGTEKQRGTHAETLPAA